MACVRISREERCQLHAALPRRDITEPHFAIYDEAFLEILGSSPKISLALEKDWPFAHEAGVYLPSQEAVYITSNILSTPDGEKEIKIGKLSRSTDGNWTYEELKTDVAMGNGGINYKDGILFCDQGNKTKPGGLVLMEPRPPYTTTPLLTSYHWRRFTSLNDVVLHSDSSIWFTDPIYGYEQNFRPSPQLPNQVYRFDTSTGECRVMADNFGRPNGICFAPREETCYVTDTDWIHGDGGRDLMRVSTIYAFDVIERHGAPFLANRRVFAMADEGIPDGIKCDLQGNVYSGCGDGVHVWTPGGKLLGKIRVAGGVANFCFGRKGELFLLNEKKFWVVKVSEKVQGALLANMKIAV